MDMLLEIKPWRLLYALLGPWSNGNITRDTTMASFVRLKKFLILMVILLEIRPWRLLYALLDPWSYGNITTDKILASFVFPTCSLVLWKYY